MHALGQMLQLGGLNEQALGELFGPAWTGEDIPLALDRYRADDPRAALVRVFLLGERVPEASFPLRPEPLLEAGLIELDGQDVVPRVRLTPFAGLLVAHDGDASDAGFVTGVNAASRTLATLTVRRPVERALDVGTGSGVEALLAARHAQTVVATDINPRALEYARLGAQLNGVSLDLREGSFFEPVDGETFDLIVCNPPFVISPDSEFVYRDSPLPGDAVCREVVRGAAAHLRAGGYATILCNWICRTADERWQPPSEWLEGLHCDALLLSHGAIEPFAYATRWNEPLRREPGAYAAAVGRWLDYYERQDVAAIGIGAVVLRGRHGPGWVRGLTASGPAGGAAGEHLLRLFAAVDRGTDGLLDECLSLVPGHRLDQTLVYEDGGYSVAGVTMSLREGAGLAAEIDAEAVPLLFELGAGRTVRTAAETADVDPAAADACVRSLFELGLVERAV